MAIRILISVVAGLAISLSPVVVAAFVGHDPLVKGTTPERISWEEAKQVWKRYPLRGRGPRTPQLGVRWDGTLMSLVQASFRANDQGELPSPGEDYEEWSVYVYEVGWPFRSVAAEVSDEDDRASEPRFGELIRPPDISYGAAVLNWLAIAAIIGLVCEIASRGARFARGIREELK